jgi:hypothetical protein
MRWRKKCAKGRKGLEEKSSMIGKERKGLNRLLIGIFQGLTNAYFVRRYYRSTVISDLMN